MVSSSFQQTSFLGGEWSEDAQGRITDPNFKRALAVSTNAMPKETGAWTRRPGLRFLGLTRHGAAAKLFQFDFSSTQPYQIELTDGYLRLWAGLAPVIADNTDGYLVIKVSAATPAVVTTGGIPATWADGNTVMFDINSVPCSAPALCGRQFTIKSVDTTAGTFALYDPITDAAIDGSTLAFVPPLDGVYLDVVKKIFEIATPYVSGQWADVRVTNNGEQVTLFHPSYQPRTLSLDTAEPFALSVQDFNDGPYLNLNATTTTLTPSGTSGSITMTASSTTGINGGAGFKTTDVGRALRFQSAPPLWNAGTNYAKKAQVTGTDSNVYEAIAASAGIDPTSDNGSHWIISATTATWVWMRITAWTSTTVVTCLVEGAADLSQQSPTILGNTLSSATAQVLWQLGSFSDTTGWPSIGCYHNSRLWLANTTTPNRYDAGVDGDFFNFCPTALDGSLSDANGFTDVIQTEEVDAVLWMLSTGEGLMIGTHGSEHRIRASVLDDPLSFTNQQERRVSKFGSKNMEAVLPWGRPVFVQSKGRKVLSLRPVADTVYDGDHISKFAQQIAARGIEEMRWQQEPALTLWMRLSDGGLAGAVYRDEGYRFGYEMSDLNYSAFFPVEHAYARTFTSISTGPNFDGTSNALYTVTNQPDNTKPDYNVHHVEYMMPMFDDASKDWGAYFVDGGASPCCGREFLVSNGDAFNGVRLYGLTYLNGLSVSVVIGGLDLGDYTVANGYVDLVFGTPTGFTQAFFEALSDGTDYGAFEADVSFIQVTAGTVPHPADSIGMYDDIAQTQYNKVVFDPPNNVVWKLGSTGGLVKYDYTTFGAITYYTAAALNLLPWETATNGFTIFNGYIIGNKEVTNHSQKFRVTIVDGTRVTYGTSSSSLTASGSQGTDGYAMTTSQQIIGLKAGTQLITAHVGTGSGGLSNEIALMDVASFKLMVVVNGFADTVFRIDENLAYICEGPYSTVRNFASFFALGGKLSFSAGDKLGVYWFRYEDGVLTNEKLALLDGPDIDATWTQIAAVSKPYYISATNTIIFHTQTLDSVTHKSNLVCYDPVAKAVKWTLPSTFNGLLDPSLHGPITGDHIIFATGALNPSFQKVRLTDGVVTATYTFNSAISANFGFVGIDGAAVVTDLQVTWGVNPTFIGTFAIADGANPPRDMPAKLFFGEASATTYTSRSYSIPTSIGLTYTSQGQLLPPDSGPDAGARNGPAFGKKRRIHWYAARVTRSRGLKFGTEFSGKMRPMKIATSGGTIEAEPALISDVVTTTIDDDYSFKGQIAWEISRPYPVTITTIGGYIEAMDK